MAITFKPIRKQDIGKTVLMMQDFYAIDNYPIDPEVSKSLLEEFIDNEDLGKGWIILNNDEVAGYVILTFVFSFEYKGRIAFLDELYISPSGRGKGIGKQALDFIHEQALDLSINIIYLEIEGHNTIAQKLYLSKDFNVHNRNLMKLVVKK